MPALWVAPQMSKRTDARFSHVLAEKAAIAACSGHTTAPNLTMRLHAVSIGLETAIV
jgi:hypothetical protein